MSASAFTDDLGRTWEPEPDFCDCDGPWMIDGFIYKSDDPLLTMRPHWPYTTPHRVWHLREESDG